MTIASTAGAHARTGQRRSRANAASIHKRRHAVRRRGLLPGSGLERNHRWGGGVHDDKKPVVSCPVVVVISNGFPGAQLETEQVQQSIIRESLCKHCLAPI